MKSIINILIKEKMMQFFFIVVLFAFQVVNPQRKQIFEEDAVQVAQQYMHVVEGNGSCQTAAISSRFFTGQAEGDQFGFSVSPAGDVNGDGFADVIIGAASNDAGGLNAGRAYLYFGGLNINSVPDIVFTGANIDDNLGYSVSTAGDVNGDGYDDIIIGSPNNDGAGSNYGRVDVHYGGPLMDNIPDVVIAPTSRCGSFGYSVATAGDVNGDGYDDIIIGTPYYYGGSPYPTGAAFIYYGGSSMNNTADVTILGQYWYHKFGYSVSSAGDVNGDGYDDVIVGNLDDEVRPGTAHIFFGGSTMNNVADVSMSAPLTEHFGYSVSTAGDVNGDGYSDVIIGSYGNDAGGENAGRTYIYFGGLTIDDIPDVTLTGVAANDFFGSTVSTAGDVNADGYSDVIVGATGNDVNGNDAGRAYVFLGGSNMDTTPDIILTGTDAENRFGNSVSSAGDVNADGYADILVGAYYNSSAGANAGRTYLYVNSLTGKDITDEFFTGTNAEDYLGYSVSTAGDVNGDGYDDVLIGSPLNDGAGNDYGRVDVHYGGPLMDNIPDVVIAPTSRCGSFGYSVATAGDVNGDGYDDIIIGTPYYYGGSAYSTGAAFIYYGGSPMNNTPDVTILGQYWYHKFGFSVSTAGDVNGDGYSDVIVGNLDDEVRPGTAHIFFGGSTMNNVADVSMSAPLTEHFGYSVSTAGDVNGDGYSDVIVGSYGNDAGGENAGRVFIYFGSSAMNNIADVTLTGTIANDFFGCSVSTAGDVNADGYSDVIVGATGNDDNGNDAGRAYLFLGASEMDNTPDVVILTGAAAENRFGNSVSSAGDVNADGYSDILVGAYYNSSAGTNAGKTYIFFGGANIYNSANITMTGEAATNYFGYSVSSAGDVNGDGFADIIIGAYGYNSNKGKSYLFLSSAIATKPRITSIKDVANDQGGALTITFNRTAYDVKGQTKYLSNYEVLRSLSPVKSGYAWEKIASITPLKEPRYSYTAETVFDSMTNQSGTLYFKIIARTQNDNEYYVSNIVSGHSVDNLAPASVSLFRGSVSSGQITLSWGANTEEDLYGYYLYRSTDATINPDITTPLIVVQDTSYVDRNPLPGSSYYFIRAKDTHGNYSQLRSSSNNPLPVELSMFEAKVNGTTIHLKWRSATEVSLLKFEIEKALKTNNDWQIIGEIEAHGNSNSPKEYGFTDNRLTVGGYLYRLKMVNSDGTFKYSESIEVDVKQPDKIALEQNYPNPFNPVTKIKYQIPDRVSFVTLKVYDILGNEVTTLVNEEKEPGYYEVEFNSKSLSSGTYFYRLSVGKFVQMKKMLLIK